MPPWPLSAPRRGAIFAQLICPRRFFVPARLLFFCFYSWPLGGEPYSLGFFCHGRILIPARFFVISHWPALGGEPHSPGLFRHGRILIPARFFVTSHWPALGGRPYSPGLFCHGGILIPVRFFCHIPLAGPRRGPHSPGLFCNGGIRVPAQLISIPVQRTIRSRLPGKNPGGRDNFLFAPLPDNNIP